MTRRGCIRFNAKRDANEEAIIRDLKRCGCSVKRASMKDFPDLVVGFRGINYLLEVKSENGKPSAGQLEFACDWRGRKPQLVRSSEEALRAIGALK